MADLEVKLDPSLSEGAGSGQGSTIGNGKAAIKRATGKGIGSVGRVGWGEFKVISLLNELRRRELMMIVTVMTTRK